MQINEFSEELQNQLKSINQKLTDKQITQFYEYMKLLIQWNKNINLTAITDEKEIITKHFVDSLTILKYIDYGKKVIDIGTGAGFPGIPVKIAKEDIKVLLLDSLNKRVNFLDNVIGNIKLENIETVHTRVEDFAHNKQYREKFDIVTARAVASLNILLEYMLPLVRLGGKCICMKGSNIDEQIKNSSKALKILGGKITNIEEFCLPNSDIKRNIVIIEEIRTNSKYVSKKGWDTKQKTYYLMLNKKEKNNKIDKNLLTYF